jgi:uncharacterized membrane protein
MSESPRHSIPPLAGALQITIADAGRVGNIAIVRCYSLSFFARACIFVATCIALMAIGALFTVAAGAWPVLIFCMLQAAVLARIWTELELHADDHEYVSIDNDAVQVDALCRKRAQQCRFQRHWARAVWSDELERLCVRSHGREIEIAAGASKDDKLAVYRHLGRLLGTARASATHS